MKIMNNRKRLCWKKLTLPPENNEVTLENSLAVRQNESVMSLLSLLTIPRKTHEGIVFKIKKLYLVSRDKSLFCGCQATQ